MTLLHKKDNARAIMNGENGLESKSGFGKKSHLPSTAYRLTLFLPTELGPLCQAIKPVIIKLC